MACLQIALAANELSLSPSFIPLVIFELSQVFFGLLLGRPMNCLVPSPCQSSDIFKVVLSVVGMKPQHQP